LAVYLDHVGTGFDGLLKSQAGIFREIAGGAAVGYFDESGHQVSSHGVANSLPETCHGRMLARIIHCQATIKGRALRIEGNGPIP
jgi:hypothetical protein